METHKSNNGNFVGDQIVHEKYLTTEVGVDFTFSVFLRTNGTITSKPYFRFRDRNTVHSKDVIAVIENRGSYMYRLWATCAGGLSDNLLVFQLMNFATSGATYAEFRYPQLEYGNKPTSWREAPEDLGAKFEVLHDQIKSEIHAVEIHNKNLLLNSDIDMMDSAQGYNIGSEFYVDVQKTKDGWWRINCPSGVTDGEFFIEEYMEGLIQEGVYTESIEMRSDSNVVAGLQFYSKYGVYPIISSEQTKIGTNHWRLEGTFRVLYENAGVRKVDVAHISAPNATYVEFRFPMLTEGSEYVPWQPAVEDETELRAHVTRHDSEISQLSDEISLMVSKTDYDENNQEISRQFSEIKQTATNISLKVDNTVNDLQKTGIDISNKKIVFTADNTVIQDNSGNKAAVFTVKDGKPLLAAENIDVENLSAKKMETSNQVFENLSYKMKIDAEDSTLAMIVKDSSGEHAAFDLAFGQDSDGYTIADMLFNKYSGSELLGRAQLNRELMRIESYIRNQIIHQLQATSEYIMAKEYNENNPNASYQDSIKIGANYIELSSYSRVKSYTGATKSVLISTPNETIYLNYYCGIFVGTSSTPYFPT